MKIHCMIFICPECKRVLTFLPHADGVFYSSSVICAEDGRHMVKQIIDDDYVSRVLKGMMPI